MLTCVLSRCVLFAILHVIPPVLLASLLGFIGLVSRNAVKVQQHRNISEIYCFLIFILFSLEG